MIHFDASHLKKRRAASSLLSILEVIFLFLNFAHASNPLKGLYAGMATGVMALDGRTSFAQQFTPGPASSFVSFSNRLSATSLSSVLFLGYGRKITRRLIVGGEIYTDLARPSSSYTILIPPPLPPGSIGLLGDTVKKKALFGLSLRLGMEAAQHVTSYFKLGVEFSSLTYTASLFDVPSQEKSHNNLAGLVTGFGAEITLIQNLLLRLEWVYTFYNTITPKAIRFSGGQVRNMIKLSPRTQTLRFGVGYKF